jgi:squalene-associated FAD-dependent desaturase
VTSRARAIVIGGGLAGIAAALDLAGAPGTRVTLLEVRPRLGGAVYSFERDGALIDNGQHVFLRCCTAYRALLARIGGEAGTRLQPRLEIPVLSPGRPRAVLRRGTLPAPLHLSSTLLRYPRLSRADRVRAAAAALALGRVDPDDPANDERTFGEWLAAHGQGPAAVAALWDLIALPTLNVPAAEASLALAAFVFRTGLLSDRAAGDIGLHEAPLLDIVGRPALEALRAAGVDVRLGCRAGAVRVGPDGRGLEVPAGGDRLEGDAVVVAVPHQRAEALLPGGALEGLRRPGALESSPIVNVHVRYDRPVLFEPFAAGVGTPVQYVFDRSAAAGLERGRYVAISLSGARAEMEMTNEELQARFVPALAELLPRARAAQVQAVVVSREHAATFRASPGVGAKRPGPHTHVPGLILAGSWTDTGWPATMEGAVRSGQLAARLATERLFGGDRTRARPGAAVEVLA